jgi:ferredoxin-NADP reductase
VKRFRPERVDGGEMPIFPAAHVVVAMRDGDILRRNTYSLMSSTRYRAYELSILRVENSRGGSAFLHEKLKVGDTLVSPSPQSFSLRCAAASTCSWRAASALPFMAMMDR